MATTPFALLRRPRHLVAMLYALGAYAVAGITVPLMLLFAGGMLLPRHVGRGPRAPTVVAIVVDILLIVLFGLQHSVMSRGKVKTWCERRIPQALYRSTYVLASCAAIWVLMVGWRPMTGTLWHLNGAFGSLADTGFWIGFVIVYLATLTLSHFYLLGIEQAYRRYVACEVVVAEPTIHLGGVYRLVRHPLMTGLLVCFWSARTMTAGRLLFAAGMSVYIVVGTMFEERDLIATFGVRYQRYVSEVPAFLPSLSRRVSAGVPASTRNPVPSDARASPDGIRDHERTPPRFEHDNP